MPGYESERFVSLCQSDREEFSCSICQDILRAPVVAKCCRQTFCEDCITNWLSAETTCPYDRQPLNTDGLSHPPRLLLNMLSKLQISCDFKDNGCQEVVTLEQLTHHTYRCPYGLGKCKQCLCSEQKVGHSCVHSLLQLNRKVSQANSVLKRELLLAMTRNGETSAADEILVPVSQLQRLIDENIEMKAEIEIKPQSAPVAIDDESEPIATNRCCVIL
ncbi:unnamed protein product [Oppiella nova]|uniref:RING-type domain-containing protein n=1 Tax=Oppiella nova TaxID=334625 RepID=A0A7R9M680_9ACAR|nr:unnamed protein product [Oppiella nova]CAG2170990.1 unnamed protein product [Oppiella nova]